MRIESKEPNEQNEQSGQAQNAYTGYEYREVTVPAALASLCLDSYPCFGWERDPHRDTLRRKRLLAAASDEMSANTVRLYFRRSRTLANRTELTRLQRHFDSCIAELQALEQSKTTASSIVSILVGILGTAFMAGATFSIVAEPPRIVLSIVLAVPAFLGWIAPFHLYRWLTQRKTAEILPLMEQKYDEIDEICRQGSRLLE